MALPSPAPVSITTSWPRWISSRAPALVSATRYSSCLISLATPIFMCTYPLWIAGTRPPKIPRVRPVKPEDCTASSAAMGKIDQRSGDRGHSLEVGHRDVLGRRVDLSSAVAEVQTGQAGGVEHVGVGAAARLDEAGLVAAGGQRAYRQRDRALVTREAVGLILAGDHRLDLAPRLAGGGRAGVEDRLNRLTQPDGAAAAGLRAHHAQRRDDVAGHAALDQADVGGRLRVDAAERHRGDRTRGGQDRTSS